MNQNPSSAASHRERGAAMLEFAFMALFVLGPLTAMVIDFGQVFNIENVITRAAEEGAFAAGTSKAPKPFVDSAITNANLDAARATTSISFGSLNGIQGSKVSVTVTYSLAGTTVFPWPDFILALANVSATATVRHL